MSVTRILGVHAFAAGASLLLSQPVLGPALLSEVTGLQVTVLYPLCVLTLVLGVIAVKVGIDEEQEIQHS